MIATDFTAKDVSLRKVMVMGRVGGESWWVVGPNAGGLAPQGQGKGYWPVGMRPGTLERVRHSR